MIPSVTKPFCGDCDRVRLTADGQFRTCLFATRRVRPAGHRCGAAAADDDLAAAIEPGRRRPSGPGHRIGQVNFIRPTRSMSQIGG